MSTRIRKSAISGKNYKKCLKDYFGFHLEGLDVSEDGGEIQVQLVYCDFKHIDTVRRELAQMMPEVEFVKIKRNFTPSAELWIYGRMIDDPHRYPAPRLYVMKDNGDLTLTDLSEIARTQLRQLELDDDDEIPYTDTELNGIDDEDLYENAISQ